MVILSIACLMALIICNSLPAQAASVPEVRASLSDEADVLSGAAQLNVDQHRAKIVRRSPEPLPCTVGPLCNGR